MTSSSTLNAFRFTLSYAQLLVADIDDIEMANIPHPGMNHPAWILGHLILVADMGAKLLGEEQILDASWMEKYGPGSTPVSDRSAYPSKDELLTTMKEIYQRTEQFAAAAEDAVLEAKNPTPIFPQQFPTLGDLLTHVLTTHPATHLGQLSAWRRCLGKGPVLGL